MVASVDGKGAGFEVGAVKPLFATRIVAFTGVGYQYDVSADGQRFLVNTSPEQAASAPITVVLNWTAGLKKSVSRRAHVSGRMMSRQRFVQAGRNKLLRAPSGWCKTTAPSIQSLFKFKIPIWNNGPQGSRDL